MNRKLIIASGIGIGLIQFWWIIYTHWDNPLLNPYFYFDAIALILLVSSGVTNNRTTSIVSLVYSYLFLYKDISRLGYIVSTAAPDYVNGNFFWRSLYYEI